MKPGCESSGRAARLHTGRAALQCPARSGDSNQPRIRPQMSTRKRKGPAVDTALERIERRLNARTEAAWYAERINLLGHHLFGDLWEGDQPKAAAPINGQPGPSVVEENKL